MIKKSALPVMLTLLSATLCATSVDTAQVVSESTSNTVSFVTGSAVGDVILQTVAFVFSAFLNIRKIRKDKKNAKRP